MSGPSALVNNYIYSAGCPQKPRCLLCGEARYRRVDNKDVPRKTFDYIPVQHRLRLLYSDPKTAWHLKPYRKKLEDTAEGDVLRDFWDAKLCAELKRKGSWPIRAHSFSTSARMECACSGMAGSTLFTNFF